MKEILVDPSCHYTKKKMPEDLVWVARTETENVAIHHRNPALIPTALLNQGMLEGT